MNVQSKSAAFGIDRDRPVAAITADPHSLPAETVVSGLGSDAMDRYPCRGLLSTFEAVRLAGRGRLHGGRIDRKSEWRGSAAPVIAGGSRMKKASEYREHAVECRTLAAQMQGEQRKQLLEMARTWDKLAEDRSDLIRRHPELALKGEHGEEMRIVKKD